MASDSVEAQLLRLFPAVDQSFLISMPSETRESSQQIEPASKFSQGGSLFGTSISPLFLCLTCGLPTFGDDTERGDVPTAIFCPDCYAMFDSRVVRDTEDDGTDMRNLRVAEVQTNAVH